MSAHSIQTDSARALPEMAPSLCHSLEPSLLLLQLNKSSFTSAPTVPVLPPASEAAGASAWCERQQQPISRLHSLWSLYRGGAQAECNHVASQDRELIWLKITYACWLSFQLLQVPGSPVTCTNTGQKKEVYGNEWPQKYM